MRANLFQRLLLIAFLAIIAVSCSSGAGNDGNDNPILPAIQYPLSTRGRWIVDRQGRIVILRGVNYNGIESRLFEEQPPELGDFESIRRWGFNAIRFTISWEWIEPQRDVYDEAYLADWVDPVIDFAAQTGVSVILNMHQWNWSTCFDCDGRGNGAPPWALPGWTCGNCPYNGSDSYNQMQRASADFWLDMDMREEYMELWEMIALRYKDNPAIIAYDTFNEPTPGDTWAGHTPEFDRDILQPFYEELIGRIQAVDPSKLIVYECNIMHEVYDNNFTSLPFNNIVYSTHIYTGGTSGGTSGTYTGPAPIREELQRGFEEASNQGVPLYIGEFGVGSAVPIAPNWMLDEFEFQEYYMLCGTWWGLRQHNNNAHGLTKYDTREDKPELLNYVSRPYPAVTAGELISYRYNDHSKSFTMTFSNNPLAWGESLISIPNYQYPNGIQILCSDPDGLWSYTYDPAEGYLHLHVDPATNIHTILIYPAD